MCPKALNRSGFYPLLQSVFDLREVQVEVLSGLQGRGGTTTGTPGFFKLGGVKEFSAGFALIPPCIGIPAVGAGSPDIPVSQEPVAGAAVELLYGMFHNKALGIKFFEDILDDFSLDWGGGSPKFIKSNGKPTINVRMQGMIPVTECLRADPFFSSSIFSGSTVFIGTTYIKGIVASEPAKPGKGIRGQDLNQIPQVGYIIHIRQRGGD
jgi:hypothetical protein